MPERPDLDQLRRQAKELRGAVRRGDAAAVRRFAVHYPGAQPDTVSLAAAQLVVARELGFSSWPRLKAAIDADTVSRRAISAFVTASVDGRLRQARDIYAAEPEIADRSLLAATVLGDVAAVRQLLAADPDAAVAIDDERGWPPLLYACYSRWHQIDPARAHGIAEVVRLLLDAGASPNTNDGGRQPFRSALKGAVQVDNPDVVEVLLDAGANPDLGQPINEAAGRRDHRCLQLLLSHGAGLFRTWAIGGAVFADDAVAVRLLLDALRATDGAAAQAATGELLDAAANASLPVVLALLDAGADPRAIDANGVSALRRAVRAGRDETAAHLRALGATDDGTDVDRFIGACLTADRVAAQQLLADHPDLPDRLTDRDRVVIIEAAGSRSAEAIALMLELGFSHRTSNKLSERPLHNAAYSGNAAVVRVLLDAGAEVDARDARFDGTALAFATVGSGEQAGRPGDWIETVRLLLDAGADRHDVWVAQKPPSEEVAELLQGYGITPPDEPVEQEAEHGDDADEDDEAAEPPAGSIGSGAMAEVARHLEASYRDRDVELFASLLHPDVKWAQCTTRAQVIDWYRAFLADGTVAAVQSVEVDRDAILVTLDVGHQAEGARPVPPERRCQVFTVEGAQIVDIRGYRDRHAALSRG